MNDSSHDYVVVEGGGAAGARLQGRALVVLVETPLLAPRLSLQCKRVGTQNREVLVPIEISSCIRNVSSWGSP